MSNYLYAVTLGIFAWFTGELITFLMLGFVLISLNNINSTLKKIYLQNNEKRNNGEQ
ncbi:hypothetical protein ACIQ2D_15105 [Lysinibacillus sp. NPDC097287]|uniref:hypothetical protein n=1 Tax=Lysinibacillus sp. NPDC097287 TaxID=3364144 RepID=UPI0037F8BD7F